MNNQHPNIQMNSVDFHACLKMLHKKLCCILQFTLGYNIRNDVTHHCYIQRLLRFLSIGLRLII